MKFEGMAARTSGTPTSVDGDRDRFGNPLDNVERGDGNPLIEAALRLCGMRNDFIALQNAGARV